ncbi:HEPN/Toprim-associated domain-containing protein [Paraburkholderia caribensis]|uniref:HEPN/Toprim-associated domain-containing protein n=1 Tax=Paraburkholderia caribensis TaxID=75105 RepID=UPI001CB196D6|nr:HEPN/Toprim-associated domain-containing protein [Paraburkholderia caribensis]CAG9242114.1 HEPN_Toprim_N domain-containing protein [Paraburkholderia caribensis]
MGMPSAFITINGYGLKTTRLGYRRWRFKREDRAIRPMDRREYLYVTSAAVMRKRLAEAGYNRTALELEYLRTLQKIHAEGAESYFDVRCYAGRYTSAERADACRRASLNDWLFALKENITNHMERFPDPPEFVDEPGRPAEVNVLIDTLACSRSTIYPIETEHLQNAFPCASLDCMAVAMLEVVPDTAECILDVTSLVDHVLVYCFDDLRFADETAGDERYEI